MIKSNCLRVAFMFAIAVTAPFVFADEGCENKTLPGMEPLKDSVSASSANTPSKGCESKISPSDGATDSSEPANRSPKQASSKPGQNIVYFGGGVSRKGDGFNNLGSAFGDFSDNEMAFTFGYLRVPNSGRLMGGVDIGFEGTMLDGTYGSYSTRGAFSFNGVVGVNVAKKDSVRFDVAGLIGARERTTDCPSSFLGYACYANQPPARSYSVNYGGIAAFSFKKLMLGARVTGASTQGLIGIRF